MLKQNICTEMRSGLHYQLDAKGKRLCFKPWLGDCLAFLYDSVMARSIFPKKFAADMQSHAVILRDVLQDVHARRVLELATGSGSAADFLPVDNSYIGTDISTGLLKRARNRFRRAGFEDASFYVASAAELPFQDQSFDLALCFLSFNFFPDQKAVIHELQRLLLPGAALLGVVPLPERKTTDSPIRGTLPTEAEWFQMFAESGFRFESLSHFNGALLYFRAVRGCSGC